MTTTVPTYRLPETTKPTTIESVTFRDGMIVTADDLDAAMRYPASLLHTVFRAFFGCGVVCGMGLRVKKTAASDKDPAWVLRVDRGVAMDCHGHPIELCAPVELDLSPKACACEDPPGKVCIAVRRTTSNEALRDACTCDTDEHHFDCRRVRDHVVVKAFTEPELTALSGVCQWTAEDAKIPPCDALTACSACSCGDCWIVLGCVELKKDTGIVGSPTTAQRRWVKPIAALCSGLVARVGELEKLPAKLDDLEKRVAELEKKPALRA